MYIYVRTRVLTLHTKPCGTCTVCLIVWCHFATSVSIVVLPQFHRLHGVGVAINPTHTEAAVYVFGMHCRMLVEN